MSRATALLIGLKAVDPERYDGWDGREACEGCEKDVESVGKILGKLGYAGELLLTEQATAEAVLGALRSRAEELDQGDILVVHYSGHGGQEPDWSGDERDGLDETLIVFDRPVVDDELERIWVKFRPGVRIVMISDSCNSGTNYRRQAPRLPRSSPFRPVVDRRAAKRMRAQLIHMGGARDGTGAAGDERGGAFTRALVGAWAKGKFQGSYLGFHRAIRDRVRGQEITYAEYGPVTEAFRGQRPFTPEPPGEDDSGPAPADRTRATLETRPAGASKAGGPGR